MIEAASLGLADSLTDEERSLDLVYPRIERIREISSLIALSVIRAAQKAGVDRASELRPLDDMALLKHIKGKMCNPEHTSHL